MNDIKTMKLAADNLRILSASMVEKANSGHPGGAMGGADFINVLFSEYLVYDPADASWPARDRFFLDPGHMSTLLYGSQALCGRFSLEELKQFRQWGSPCPGHPERDIERGIENTSGPLGQGHVFGIGAAIAAKFLGARLSEKIMCQKIYVYISDGGIQEEISQGAGRIAGHLGLDNVIMFYDSNDIQLSTDTASVTSEDVALKYKAWGWKVIEIDGNDVVQIRKALDEAQTPCGQPVLIIGKTIMGKGALREDGSSYEACCSTHGAPLGGNAYRNTITALGGNPDDPFQIFPEVQALYAARKEELSRIVAKRRESEKAWAAANPEKAAKLEKWFKGAVPEIDWSKVEQKPDNATRAASATVLGVLAEQVENMVVSSADLSNSDKTDGFLKKTHAFTKGDFSG
ncbi:MAG: transketolase, partial [Bacteroidales bacterium]|nr:transketolase [Bacteroidales bacterium]